MYENDQSLFKAIAIDMRQNLALPFGGRGAKSLVVFQIMCQKHTFLIIMYQIQTKVEVTRSRNCLFRNITTHVNVL